MKSNKFTFTRHVEELFSLVGIDEKCNHGILSYTYYHKHQIAELHSHPAQH